HRGAELFRGGAGVAVVGVPYKSGGESLTAVLAAQVDATIEGITILLPHIRAEKLRALAVTSRERTPLAPDLPTMIEAGAPDYQGATLNRIAAPAATPAGVGAKLNAPPHPRLQTPQPPARPTQPRA